MENKSRWGELHEYRDLGIYEVDYGWYADKDEKTAPWLVWNPPDKAGEDAPEEVRHVNALQENGNFLREWEPFREGREEQFTLSHFFENPNEESPIVKQAVRNLGSKLNLDASGMDHLNCLPTLKTIRDESRGRLGKHIRELEEEVMQPLRNVLIPCAVEARRSLTDFRSIRELDEGTREKWLRTIKDLHHLWWAGIGGGISWDIIHEHENWYGRTFQYVPDSVAEGAKVALKTYVEHNKEKPGDLTRDGILNRAEPVYLKWEASRYMMWSALYGWELENMTEAVGNEHEKLMEVLLDDRKRLEWIGEELMGRGDTWRERFNELERVCDKLNFPSDSRPPRYKNPESLSRAYRNHVERKTERRSD